MSDKNLEKQIGEYADLVKEVPGVDINLLMMSALKKETERVSPSDRSYKWPYMVSLGLPPFGLLFALKFFITGDDNDRTAAYVCIGLTIVSIILTISFGKLVFSSSGTSVEQIQQINTKDILQLTQ